MLLAAALALHTGCAPPAAPAPPPLPEGNAYVRALVERHRERELLADSYAYDLTEEREELDGQGRVRRRESRRGVVFHVQGRPVRTLVEENGRALPPKRAAREAAESRRQAAAIASGAVAVERPAVRLSRLLEASAFTTVGRDDVDGRPALRLEFAPRAGAATGGDRALRRLAGRVWIDEAEGQVVRAAFHNTEPLRVRHGLLASVSRLEVELEFRKVDDLVWLPKSRRATVSGRKLLFAGFRLRTTTRYGSFRRFTVDAHDEPRP
jgi:hypothetical protein